ncbi:hypothetical protein [Azospirillum largimobile]
MRTSAHPLAVRQAYSFNPKAIPCEIVTGQQSSAKRMKKALNR